MNQDIINIGIALFGALFGLVLKTVWNAVTEVGGGAIGLVAET